MTTTLFERIAGSAIEVEKLRRRSVEMWREHDAGHPVDYPTARALDLEWRAEVARLSELIAEHLDAER